MNISVLISLLKLLLKQSPLSPVRASVLSTIMTIIKDYSPCLDNCVPHTLLRLTTDNLHAANYEGAMAVLAELHTRCGDFISSDGSSLMPHVRPSTHNGSPIFFVEYIQESVDNPPNPADAKGKDGTNSETDGPDGPAPYTGAHPTGEPYDNYGDKLCHQLVESLAKFDEATSRHESGDAEYEAFKHVFNEAAQHVKQYGYNNAPKSEFPICPGATCKRHQLEESAQADHGVIVRLRATVSNYRFIAGVRLDLLRKFYETLIEYRQVFPADWTQQELDSDVYQSYKTAYDEVEKHLQGVKDIECGTFEDPTQDTIIKLTDKIAQLNREAERECDEKYKAQAVLKKEGQMLWNLYNAVKDTISEYPAPLGAAMTAYHNYCKEDDPRGNAVNKSKQQRVIQLTPVEVQSGYDRLMWAESLIKQLPKDHEGAASWLLNYGSNEQSTTPAT